MLFNLFQAKPERLFLLCLVVLNALEVLFVGNADHRFQRFDNPLVLDFPVAQGNLSALNAARRFYNHLFTHRHLHTIG